MIDPEVRSRALSKIKANELVFGDPDVIAYIREEEKDAENRKKAGECGECKGTTKIKDDCAICDGTGEVTVSCDDCEGSGEVEFSCGCQTE